MKSNTMFILVVLSLTVSFLIEPAHAVAADYQIIESGFPIAITPRHEQQPWNEYNPIDNNYMITYNTMGKLRDYCSSPDAYECNECFHSIETVTLSPGGTIQALSSISPPEGRLENCSWKSMPRVAHNPMSNEYLMIFAKKKRYIMPSSISIIYFVSFLLNGKFTISHSFFLKKLCYFFFKKRPDAEFLQLFLYLS